MYEKDDLSIDYKSKKYYVGSEFYNKKGTPFKVIGKSKSIKKHYYIEFQDGSNYVASHQSGNIERGTVGNPFDKTVSGIGYFGVGKYKNTKTVSYSRWSSMIERCYSGNKKEYENVSVCSKWHNYQNYAKWFDSNYVEKYDIDKDLLQQDVEYKIYSHETCIFIPEYINSFLTNKQKRLNLTSDNTGVHFDKRSGVWIAKIGKDRKYLGSYKTEKMATNAYDLERASKVKLLQKEMTKLGYSINIVELLK